MCPEITLFLHSFRYYNPITKYIRGGGAVHKVVVVVGGGGGGGGAEAGGRDEWGVGVFDKA